MCKTFYGNSFAYERPHVTLTCGLCKLALLALLCITESLLVKVEWTFVCFNLACDANRALQWILKYFCWLTKYWVVYDHSLCSSEAFRPPKSSKTWLLCIFQNQNKQEWSSVNNIISLHLKHFVNLILFRFLTFRHYLDTPCVFAFVKHLDCFELLSAEKKTLFFSLAKYVNKDKGKISFVYECACEWSAGQNIQQPGWQHWPNDKREGKWEWGSCGEKAWGCNPDRLNQSGCLKTQGVCFGMVVSNIW